MARLLALSGQIASGKTDVSKYLEAEYGYARYSGSDILRGANEELKPEYRMPLETRADYDRFQRVWKSINGRDGLGKLIANVLQRDDAPDKLCYEGLRNVYDAERIRKAGGIIVALECDFETRYRRVLERHPEHAVTRSDLERDDALEFESQDAVGLHLRQVLEAASIRVDASQPIKQVVRELQEKLRERGMDL